MDSCPYHAITLVDVGEDRQQVYINQMLCKGCGHCQAVCPKEGVGVSGFTPTQLRAELHAVLMEA